MPGLAVDSMNECDLTRLSLSNLVTSSASSQLKVFYFQISPALQPNTHEDPHTEDKVFVSWLVLGALI